MLGREGPLARVAREEALSRASPWPAHVLGAVKENPAAANSAESDGLGPFAIEEHNKRQVTILVSTIICSHAENKGTIS
ncbi:uncharacterized protein LOC120644598 isoform X4 [Panicum virgatum]|uniref:uncharacterized protein LOC120644598 isoform X4 n=1 Tax=Panicum virgatum TaxID=38727 RepID=UPI0019D55B25|nr:uncharacterized protein LOC120644598 isoform X4 [Panicum virgatum]